MRPSCTTGTDSGRIPRRVHEGRVYANVRCDVSTIIDEDETHVDNVSSRIRDTSVSQLLHTNKLGRPIRTVYYTGRDGFRRETSAVARYTPCKRRFSDAKGRNGRR